MLTSKKRDGFTLIELMVVVVIIGIMAGLLIPKLPDVTASRLKSTARKIAGAISYVYQRAAASQLVMRITFDMDENEYYISLLNSDRQFEETELPFAKRTKLPDNVKISDAQTATQGLVTKGKAVLHFFPGGMTEPVVIHLQDSSSNQMTLLTKPLTGRVKIKQGHFNYASNKT